jgi:hypothetical protein
MNLIRHMISYKRIPKEDQEFVNELYGQFKAFIEDTEAMLSSVKEVDVLDKTYGHHALYIMNRNRIEAVDNLKLQMRDANLMLIGYIEKHFKTKYNLNFTGLEMTERRWKLLNLSLVVNPMWIYENMLLQTGDINVELGVRNIKRGIAVLLAVQSRFPSKIIENEDSISFTNVYWSESNFDGNRALANLLRMLSYFEFGDLNIDRYDSNVLLSLKLSKLPESFKKAKSMRLYKNGKVTVAFRTPEYKTEFINLLTA